MTRCETITHRIDRETTGLKASCYIHADLGPDGRVIAIRLTDKGKDDSTLDRLFREIGDAVTDILGERHGREKGKHD